MFMGILDKVLGDNVPEVHTAKSVRKSKIVFHDRRDGDEDERARLFRSWKQRKTSWNFELNVKYIDARLYKNTWKNIQGKLSVVHKDGRRFTRTDEYADVWTDPNGNRWSTSRLLGEAISYGI